MNLSEFYRIIFGLVLKNPLVIQKIVLNSHQQSIFGPLFIIDRPVS